MANAVCCDRCGVFDKVGKRIHNQLTIGHKGWRKLSPDGPTPSDPLGEVNSGILLCPKCNDEFEAFMQYVKPID